MHPERPDLEGFGGNALFIVNCDYLSLLYDIEAEQPVARTHGTMLLQIRPSLIRIVATE
jgi:lactam utilization protein B